jgi:hypothetical protein
MVRRRFTLTATTVDYLSYLMRKKSFNQKEKSVLISTCIEAYYEVFAHDLESFRLECMVNVCLRGTKADEVWCQLSKETDEMLNEMVGLIAEAPGGFMSPSSLVNHAIGRHFSMQPLALSKYLKSLGIRTSASS